MRKRTKGSYILIAALFCFSMFVFYLTKDWPKATHKSGFGPGFYPDLLTIVLLVLLAILFFQEWTADRRYRKAKAESRAKADAEAGEPEALTEEDSDEKLGFNLERIKMPAFFIVLMIIYTALINTLGFITDTILFLFSGMIIMKARPLPSILISVLFTAFLYLIFGLLLKVQLPLGEIWGGTHGIFGI